VQNKGTAEPRQYVFCILAPFGGTFCGRVGFMLGVEQAAEKQFTLPWFDPGPWPSGSAICVACCRMYKHQDFVLLHGHGARR
jgi:hypothetical protein